MKNCCILSMAVTMLTLSAGVQAGRPLSVDDANVNDAGAGHVEAWYARQPGKTHTWNVAPAYSPLKDVELSGLISRDSPGEPTTSSAQVKWRITPSKSVGCNVGLVVGISHASQGGGNTRYLNGLATCNHAGGALHVNLGLSYQQSVKTLGTWGVAYERELGPATGHVEIFGQESQKPTAQVGIRKDVLPGLQLDGTIGRSAGDTIFSVGLKKSF